MTARDGNLQTNREALSETLSQRERVAAEQPGEGLRRRGPSISISLLQPLTRRLRRHPLPLGEGNLTLRGC